jgi:molecular chaperone GrpE
LNTEEHKREPEAEGTDEGHDKVDEAQGSPTDPASEAASVEGANTAADTEVTEVIEEAAPEPPVEEEPAVAEDELAALADELEATRGERDEYLDALRRLKAEFENARKRQERERARILETASENLVLGLLPVLDNLDRALEAEGDIREGVRATRDQLADVLGREGLIPVASDGQHFDPNVHEAVMGQPSNEHEEGTILQTFERGYLLNGKPIRPAKVVVARQG